MKSAKTNQIRFVPVITLLLFSVFTFAQNKTIPTGYYNSASGLSGETLKQALHDIIDNHTELSYDDLWEVLPQTDADPNNSNNFILIYTGRSIPKTEVYPAWNREHVWAKSHGDFGTTPPAGTDAHHLRPEDVSVNSARGNKDFDEGGTQHSEATECYYTANTWEPRDAVKGDVARMMFYMAVRYEGDASGEPDLELVDYVTNPTEQPVFGVLSTLLKWNQEDPVDDFERNRNEVVYSYQHNRNPFVDHPEYVSSIWGGNSGSSINNVAISPANPTSGDVVSISANVVDAEGIASVVLYWGTQSGNLSNTLSMSTSGSDLYTTASAIPAHTNGTTVYYQLKVSDTQSSITTSTVYSYTVGGNSGETINLFTEDFETCQDYEGITLAGWTNYIETGTRNWVARFYSNNLYAQATSYGSGEVNKSWLITPAINLSGTTQEVFSFDINVGYWKHNGFNVFLSSNFDGTHVTAASWQEITSNFTIPTTPTNAYGTLHTAGSYSLNSYSGTIYIAFVYNGNESSGFTETTTYQVDNVKVTGVVSTTDETAPQLSITPTDGETDISVGSTIQIFADEPLRKADGSALDATYTETKISLTHAGGSSSFSTAIDATQKIITVTPNAPLDFSKTYSVTLADAAFADSAGNTTSSLVVSFTTEVQPDETAPVLTLAPANGSQNVELNVPIKITSAESLKKPGGQAIDASYVSTVVSLKKGEQILSVTTTISADQKEIQITPVQSLEYQTSYSLTVANEAFADTAGNTTLTVTTAFTTKVQPDGTAPVLTLAPANGSQNVELNAPIKITSTEGLKKPGGQAIDASYVSTVVSLKKGEQNLSVTATILADQKEIQFTPEQSLEYLTEYTLVVNNQAFADTALNLTSQASSTFTTIPEPDVTSPVLQLIPENGMDSVLITAKLKMISNEPLRKNNGEILDNPYVETVIHLKQGTNDVPVTITISPDAKEIELLPNQPLGFLTEYTLSVTHQAFADVSGNQTSEISSVFLSQPEGDIVAPELTLNLMPNTTLVSVDTFLLITSNELLLTSIGAPIDHSYIENHLILRTGNVSGNDIAFIASLNDSHTEVILTVPDSLQYQTPYYFEVPAGVFTDTAGNTTITYQVKFKTRPVPDVIAPQLLIIPEQNSVNVEINTSIQISSNEPLFTENGSNLTTDYIDSMISLKKAGDIAVPFSTEICANTRMVTLHPVANLLNNTHYTVTIASHAFTDSAGNTTSELVSEFTTISIPDTKAPAFMAGFPKTGTLLSDQSQVIVAIDEPGKIFYLLKLKTESAPTISQLLVSDYINLEQANVTDTLRFSGLMPYTAYSVYLLTQDNQPVPNTAAFALKFNFTTPGLAPEIASEPQNATICKNEPYHLSVSVNGTAPFTYQWFHNNQMISGSDNDTLSISSAQNSDTGSYYCQISNNWGNIQSNEVEIHLIPEISAGNDSIVNVVDTTGTLSLIPFLSQATSVNGIWYEGTTWVPLTVPEFDPAASGVGTFQFGYVLTNECTSDTAFITFEVQGRAPGILEQPVSQTACPGDEITFSVKITGTQPITYQWYFNNELMTLQDESTLIIHAIDEQKGTYQCHVSNAQGDVWSNPVELHLYEPVTAGSDSTVTVLVTDSEIDLTTLLSSNTSVGGNWIFNGPSGAFTDHWFYPAVAGIGTFQLWYTVTSNCMSDTATITLLVNQETGVNEINKLMVAVYPNPATDILYLKNTDQAVSYKIYTVFGLLVKEGSIRNNEIPVQELSKGEYILQLAVPTSVTRVLFVHQ